MMKYKWVLKNNIKVIVIVTLGLFLIIAFYSNNTLLLIFNDKIWAHKVNSLERLTKANRFFTGVELDVVFHANQNYFEVNHPPDKSTNLTLQKYFQNQLSQKNYNYWLDFKNLSSDIEIQSSGVLDSITEFFNIENSNIIVESNNPQFLKSYKDKGFLTSYYLPVGLHSLDKKGLENQIEKIKNTISLYDNKYISTEYKDYAIIKKHFPNNKKLIWFTHYGSMNRIEARILLYKILLDNNVDVLLIPFSN